MIWFILAIIFAILAFYFHSSADKIENSSKSYSQPPVAAPKLKTYWESFKEGNPIKAKEIEALLGIDFSTLSDRDAREKKETLERLSNGMNCSISQIKENYLKKIEKYPARLIPQMIESTSREMAKETEAFQIRKDNTASALMVKWLKERHKELGAPNASISALVSDKEMEIIELVSRGLSNKEIANSLCLSEGTVRNYLSIILEKLELRDRTQLVVFYLSKKRPG